VKRVALVAMLLTGCLSARVARIVDRAVDPSFSGVVLVARDNHTLFRKAYGLANTPATPFMIMSVSKQFTAMLILRLAAANKLRLDDPVSKYLDDWPAEWNGVEIRHLLSHSAGLDIDTTYFWLVKHHPEYWPDPAHAPPAYAPKPPLAAPGTKYQYANVGYTLLSMIASKADGRPFDELLRDEVLRPLGLTHTLPERNGVRTPGRARGYTRTDRGLQLAEQKTIDIVGAGDLVSTAGDLARFDFAFDDDRYLPATLRAEMLAPHIERSPGSSMGYAWFLRTSSDGHVIQSHPGSGAGFRAFNYRLPDQRLAIVVLSNVDDRDVPWLPPMIERIARVCFSPSRDSP